jgi:hypothetical protein
MRTHATSCMWETNLQYQRISWKYCEIPLQYRDFPLLKSDFLHTKSDFPHAKSNFPQSAFCFLQRLSAFFNSFPLSSTVFHFLQRPSNFFNGFPIFLNGFPLSKKSGKIYLWRQVYKRSLSELRISAKNAIFCDNGNCHELPYSSYEPVIFGKRLIIRSVKIRK